MTPLISPPSSGSHAPLRSKLLNVSLVGLGLLGPIFVGGQAKALTISSISCTINVAASATPCAPLVPGAVFGTLGDKEIVFQSFSIDNPGNTGVTLTYNWLDFDGGITTFGDDLWTFAVTATPSVAGPLNVGYTYDVNIVDGFGHLPGGAPNPVGTSDPWFFDQVSLESDVPADFPNPVRVVKLTTPDGVPLTSINGQAAGPVDYTFLNDYKTIRITDTISLPTGTAITSVTNAWTQREAHTVPGPLPILGAGVAFGMSRNLRRRIKARTTA